MCYAPGKLERDAIVVSVLVRVSLIILSASSPFGITITVAGWYMSCLPPCDFRYQAPSSFIWCIHFQCEEGPGDEVTYLHPSSCIHFRCEEGVWDDAI